MISTSTLSFSRKWLKATVSTSQLQRQEKALGFLLEHKKLTIKDYEKLCHDVSRRSLQRDLKEMLVKRIISSEGTTHHQEYRLL
ncbi:hypothetical protein [uncultured Desulfosarcina sp.]|uniref:hypothetical protein n=1 Tax=uncultured Desulfosarcina sp. TaxID=218289 RepID=UPI0029C73E6C|nr:hypothetical protein [uncultured Desulfosarcina sp.]